MNSKKISFISCVNDFEQYKIALRHIDSLKVPPGYEVETVAIENATSLTSGYNEAMKKSDAKYKVYLHQDVYILNEQFIYDVIRLFQNYPKLGMLGAVGGKTAPNGLWWGSPEVYGDVYDGSKGRGNLELLAHRKVINDYEQVRAIDGLIMITQYDLKWRDDLFQGWHFYDISHSFEFAKAGYEVGVAKQISPWCFHDSGPLDFTGYEENRNIVVQNYPEYVF